MKPNKTLTFSAVMISTILSHKAVADVNCEKQFINIDNKFYENLKSKNLNRHPLNEAAEFLGEIRDSGCKFSPSQKSHISYLTGEVFRHAYSLEREQRVFDQAKKSYEEALSFSVSENEMVYLNMSRLYRQAEKYDEAIDYLNKGMKNDPPPKDLMPYYANAFQLAVDTREWNDADRLMNILLIKDRHFYADVNLLYSRVVVLCHFEKSEEAQISINNVEKYVQLNESDKVIFDKSKKYFQSCNKNLKSI